MNSGEFDDTIASIIIKTLGVEKAFELTTNNYQTEKFLLDEIEEEAINTNNRKLLDLNRKVLNKRDKLLVNLLPIYVELRRLGFSHNDLGY